MKAYHLLLAVLLAGCHCSSLFGQNGNVLLFDGQSDFFSIPDDDELDYQQAITLSAWIHPNCGDGLRSIISKQWCQGDYGYYFGVRDNRLIWSYNIDGNCNDPNAVVSRDIFFTALRWYHVAVTHDETAIHLFIDGVEVEQEQYEGRFTAIRNNRQPFLIGGYRYLNGTVGNFFSGLADELRFWKTALTPAEIAAEAASPVALRTDGAVLSYHLEGASSGPIPALTNDLPNGKPFRATASGNPRVVAAGYYDSDPEFAIDTVGTACAASVMLVVQPLGYAEIQWSTGESTDEIEVTEAGRYSVTVTTDDCRSYSDTRLVNPGLAVTEVSIPLCRGDTLEVNGRLVYRAGYLIDTLVSSAGCDSIVDYTFTETSADTIELVVPVCRDEPIERYGVTLYPGVRQTVTVPAEQGCDTLYSVLVTYQPATKRDTLVYVCSPVEMVAFGGRELALGDSLLVTGRNAAGCDSQLLVRVALSPSEPLLPDSLIACDDALLIRTSRSDVIWNTGVVDRHLYVTEPGLYTASYTSATGCPRTDSVTVTFAQPPIYVPTAFSPNGDGRNDCVGPMMGALPDFTDYRFAIHGRWGDLVYTTDRPGECWDGAGGTPGSQVYIWYLTYRVAGCPEGYRLAGTINRLP
ncbi:CHU domain-containing protein [Neolewinella xylanilytica]|uniref:CHU domain-containing protein n=1 Tax=Neolewinella xylanilytica TaxID=1514080 RepID=A0A2S6IA84_9BACT|nr:LamG-like jellyroll fold domain-containing protein [Neolewinella xylanilytica]PPK88413.1 CHU domain-containing protein [Neolewinella xylanilytica]